MRESVERERETLSRLSLSLVRLLSASLKRKKFSKRELFQSMLLIFPSSSRFVERNRVRNRNGACKY